MSGLKDLIGEIHRRSLWQVLGIYLVGSWIGYSVVQGLTEGLSLPEWFPPFALMLFIVGLPIVLATAFVQEGIKPAPPSAQPAPTAEAEPAEVRREQPSARKLFTWRNVIAGGVLVFAVWGAFALGWMLLRGSATAETAGSVDTPAAGEPGGVTTATLSIETNPAGAQVTASPLSLTGALDTANAIALGVAPLSEASLPAGEYLIRFESDGSVTLELLVHLAPDDQLDLTIALAPADSLTRDMLLVSGGTYPGAPAGLAVQPFLVDRHEVTNAQYLQFVSAGGYQDPDLWQETMQINGGELAWSDAMATFVDRTGMPGPRTWSGGLYPEGKSDHPVVGISWYEASAYALWAGKQLPTWDQWWRAALGDAERAFPWGDDVQTAEARANFGLMDTQPVGAHPTGVSPFGVQDMAGNVREWLRGLSGDPPRARIVGGSWDAPPYTFDRAPAADIDPTFSGSSVGFRCVRAAPGSN